MENTNLKNKLLNFFKSSYFPFIAYAFVMVVVHAVMKMDFGDDAVYSLVLGDGNASFKTVWDFIVQRYETWSSRLVIEAILIVVVHSKIAWKILNIAVMVWISVAISLFFNKNNKASINWFIVVGMVCFPMDSLHTAGWIATTLNYTWPLGLGLLALMPIRNEVYEKKTPIWLYIASFPAFLYAINQEQMCAVMFAVCGLFAAYSIIKKKKLSWYSLLGAVLALAGMIFILTCPGNDMRTAAEIERWFPDYANLSLFRKVEMGYAFGTFEFMMESNLAYSALCFVLMLVTFRKNKKPLWRAVSVIPFVFSLSMGLFSGIFDILTPHINSLRHKLTVFGSGFTLSSPGTWLPNLFTFLMAACIVVSIWSIFKNKNKAFFATFVLLLGFATMWIMGLSPTIWASMNRTCTFMYIAVVCVGAMVLSEESGEEESSSVAKALYACFSAVFLLMLCDKWLEYFMSFPNIQAP